MRGASVPCPAPGDDMAGKAKSLVAVALVLIGVALLAYPQVSNWMAEQSRSVVMSGYDEAVAAANDEQLAEQLAQARDYNERLRSGAAVVTDPFDPNADKVSDTDYERCLNVAGDGVMGTISLPSIHVTLPVYHGTADSDLQRGAGHVQGTSLPVGGESTHCVIAGHTGLPTARIFDALDQVQIGDVFVLSVLGEKLAYRVCDIRVVLPDQTDSLSVQEGRDLVTLVTCTPYGKNTHRLLVTGERCEVPEDVADDSADADSSFTSWFTLEHVALLAAGAAVIVGAAAGIASSRRAARKKAASASGRKGGKL